LISHDSNKLKDQLNRLNPTNLSDEMQPALWSVKTTTWGAYFTGTKETRETKQTNDVPAEGSLACRSFLAKAALPMRKH
jgi:hypothetical protein